MQSQKNIVVIGAGIIGVISALNLVREGHRVTLIDRANPGETCSFGNAGLLARSSFEPNVGISTLLSTPKMLLSPNGPLSIRLRYLPTLLPWLISFVRQCFSKNIESNAQALHGLTNESVELNMRLAKSADCENLLRRSDYLQVYRTKKAFLKEVKGMQKRRKMGYQIDELNQNEIQELEPALSNQYLYGHQIHDHGFITNPGEYVLALREQFCREGGLFEQADVVDIEPGYSACKVITTTEVYSFDNLVLATGAFSSLLTKRTGIKVPLETERGYHKTCPVAKILISRPIMEGEQKFVATPMDVGLRFAGTVELGGLQAPQTPRRIASLSQNAKNMIDDLNMKESTTWLGFRSTLPDSLPVISRSPIYPNIIYAYGHQHLGLTCAPKTGQLVADLICDRTPSMNIKPFSIERFM